jgi:hypothetical protein
MGARISKILKVNREIKASPDVTSPKGDASTGFRVVGIVGQGSFGKVCKKDSKASFKDDLKEFNT